MSGIDFNIECLSCRNDSSPSGKLTSYFWRSNQSHKVDIFHLLKGYIRIFRDTFKTSKAVVESFQARPSKDECSTGDQTRIFTSFSQVVRWSGLGQDGLGGHPGFILAHQTSS